MFINTLQRSLQQSKLLILSQQSNQLTQCGMRLFTGKTETGFKFKTPKLRMKVVNPVYPPPGLNLQIPGDLTIEKFCKQIGGDCFEYADKFENINEVFTLGSKELKVKGVPTVQRNQQHCDIGIRELLRRGQLTFEYLNRRTCLDKVRDK